MIIETAMTLVGTCDWSHHWLTSAEVDAYWETLYGHSAYISNRVCL